MFKDIIEIKKLIKKNIKNIYIVLHIIIKYNFIVVISDLSLILSRILISTLFFFIIQDNI
jgi:hypothetical protein